jgi:hypothetical protein
MMHVRAERTGKAGVGWLPHIAEDKPAEQDLLGTHQTIAALLLRMVEKTETGGSVALLGSWGAGKSSAITMLRNAARTNEDIRVAVVDASHFTGGSFRRALLTELTSSLPKRWIGKTEREVIEASTGVVFENRHTVQTETTTSQSSSGVLGVILAVVVSSVSGVIWKALLVETWGIPKILLQIIVGLVALFLFSLLVKKKSENVWVCFRRVFSAFTLPNSQTTVNQHISETAKATELELQNTLGKLLDCVLPSEQANRRLIIVIDNIDRMPENERNETISVVSTFLGPVSEQSVGFRKRLWVIAPLAPSAAHPSTTTTLMTPDIKAEQQDPRGILDLNHCLEKAFNVVIRLPNPVLDNWESYARRLISDSCCEAQVDIDELDLVIRLLRASWVSGGFRITPRKIKLFSNSLAAQAAKLQNLSVPFHMHAFYLLEQRRIEDLLEGENGLDLNELTADLVGLLPDVSHLAGQLASLHYEVPEQEACHIAFYRDIEKLLHESTTLTTSMIDLFTYSGTYEVLDTICKKMALQSRNDLGRLRHATEVISKLPAAESRARDAVWQTLSDWLQSFPKMVLDPSTADTILLIMEQIPPQRTVVLAENVSRAISIMEMDTDSGVAAAKWLDGLISLRNSDHFGRLFSTGDSRVSLPGDSGFTLLLLADVRGREQSFSDGIPEPILGLKAIQDSIERRLSSGEYGSTECLATQELIRSGAGIDLDGIAQAVMGQWSTVTKPEQKETLASILFELVFTGNNQQAFQLLEKQVEDGQLAVDVGKFSDANARLGAIMIIFLYCAASKLRFPPAANESSDPRNRTIRLLKQGKQALADQMVSLLQQAPNALRRILRAYDSTVPYNLMISALNNLLEDPSEEVVGVLVEDIEAAKRFASAKLVGTISQTEKVWVGSLSRSTILGDTNRCEALHFAFDYLSAESQRSIADTLAQITRDEWIRSFEHNPSLTSLYLHAFSSEKRDNGTHLKAATVVVANYVDNIETSPSDTALRLFSQVATQSNVLHLLPSSKLVSRILVTTDVVIQKKALGFLNQLLKVLDFDGCKHVVESILLPLLGSKEFMNGSGKLALSESINGFPPQMLQAIAENIEAMKLIDAYDKANPRRPLPIRSLLQARTRLLRR